MTLTELLIWTTAGLLEEGPRWTFLTCQEIVSYAEEVLAKYGGQYELRCEEFSPFHEADFSNPLNDIPEHD